MKFKQVKTLQHLLKEYGPSSSGSPTPSGEQGMGSFVAKQMKTAVGNKAKQVGGMAKNMAKKMVKGQDSKTTQKFKSIANRIGTPSPTIKGKDASVDQQMMKTTAGKVEKGADVYDKDGKFAGTVDSPLGDTSIGSAEAIAIKNADGEYEIKQPDDEMFIPDPKANEGKLGKIAKRKNKKLKIKNLKSKIKKLSRKKLKEADPKLFEINFNQRSIATEALDAPIRCGFEAETYFYNASGGGASDDVDNMSVSDVEYEYGDLPDGAYSDYNDWLMDKAMDEYLPDIVENWIEDNMDDDTLRQEFADNTFGEDALQNYIDDFAENDPTEYENRESDGWDEDNWRNDLIDEEYEADYEDFLRDIAQEEDQLRDDAYNEAEGDYTMDDWISNEWYSMSSFLDDYSYEYDTPGGGVEEVADILSNWVTRQSRFDDYPEHGEYGDTYTTTGWAVETDSSIEAYEGAGAELISPVYDSPREMLSEMKSLFKWGEDHFGTNNTTGLHVTMSWQGQPAPYSGPNRLKMAVLLGDQYLLKEFDRLRNSYTKSQYQKLLAAAEKMSKNDKSGFDDFEKILSTKISDDKFSSIHFKGEKDSKSGTNLIEFRIAGGEDYQQEFDKITKAVVRYATIMKAGYDKGAFRSDYVKAVSRLVRKSQEIDPKRLKDLDVADDPIIDAGKMIAGKKDYFDILRSLDSSLQAYNMYLELSKPNADKEWKQEIEDYKKGTGRDPSWVGESINEDEVTGYIEPSRDAPKVRAERQLSVAREEFVKAVVMLSRDVADGTARIMPSAKMIGIFRKYASKLEMSDEMIDNFAKNYLDVGNIEGENDKEKIVTLKKGLDALFKKNIVTAPDFLSSQKADDLIDKLWQFFVSDDKKDNIKLEKLAHLIDKMTVGYEYTDIRQQISNLTVSRQKNDFVRKIKGGGYDSSVAIIRPGAITDKKAIQELESFLSNYSGYQHPTTRDHHVNINSDDDYEQVSQYSLVQKLRSRLEYIKEIEKEDPDKAEDIQMALLSIAKTFISNLSYPEEDIDKGDTNKFLGLSQDSVERKLQQLNDYESDPEDFNFAPFYSDRVLDIMDKLYVYYRHKKDFENWNQYIKDKPNVKIKIKKRFKAFKTFLEKFDSIFIKQGFNDLKPEISGKDQLDKLNKDFEKNVRSNAFATFNIPSHSLVKFKKDFISPLTDFSYDQDDKERHFRRRGESFEQYVNKDSNVFVIPAAHWSQVEDAVNGLDLIDKFENSKNYFHSWRKSGYKNIIDKFRNTYGIDYNRLQGEQYVSITSEIQSKLRNIGLEVTNQGDSRAGAPGQDYLIDPKDLENNDSGEPIDRGSAMMWQQTSDNAEEKRFNAFDFSVYPDEVKSLVQNKMDDENSFGASLKSVLTDILDGKIDINPEDIGRPAERLARAAGVEDRENDSSNGIASATDWGKLADYLKIERGVNDQGVLLLKKVYDQYDGNHNWRPEPDPTVCCLPRWAAAVKAADDYIKKNYTVSGGNYFRDGDNVSKMYGGSEPSADSDEVNTDDYDDMRRKYFNFNTMMMNGMQNYMLKPDVNDLVGFLKNPNNDEEFKKAVLQSMMREREAGEEPNDFVGHLARARMRYTGLERIRRSDIGQSESVFTKFDKLPLQEQLRIVSESDVLEKWSKKYKASINCSNPKGFSQKAHCAGKKKKKESLGDVAYANKLRQQRANITPQELERRTFEKFARIHGEDKARAMIFAMKQRDPQYFINKVKQGVTESVPNNTKVRMINKLLSDEFPASDLRKQMDAYFAIPDPQMLKDFRDRRAEGGDDACLRPVLRNYIKMKLHPKLQPHINLNESREDLIAKLNDLPDDESTRKLVNYIEQLIDDMGVGGKIKSLSTQLEVIPDVDVKKAINQIAKIVASIEMSPTERAQLFVDWKSDNLVNVDALLSTSTVKMSDIYKGYGDKGESHITELVDDLNQVVQYGIGPGEFALSVLSQRIEGMGAASGEDEGKGDLIIDGSPVELKTTRKNAARFNDREVTVSDSYKSLVTAFFNKYKSKFEELEQQGLQVRVKSGMQQNHVIEFLKAVPEAEKEVAEIISNIFTNLSVSGGPIARYLAQGDKNGAMQLIAQSNVNNYLEKKRQSGNLLGILFIDLKKQTFNFIKDISDLEGSGLRLHAKTNYLITTNENPFANTSIVDSGA